MVPPEVQPLRHLPEWSVEGDLGHERLVRVVVAAVGSDPPQHVGPHHAVEVVGPDRPGHVVTVEEQATQPFRSTRRPRGEWVLEGLEDIALRIDGGRPRVSEHRVRILVEQRDAALHEVARVEVVCGGPLEERSAGVPQHDVVVRRRPDVAWLAREHDARVLGLVLPADVVGGVGGGVARDDQLEVLERLAQQRVERLCEVLGAVVDGQSDAQLRYDHGGSPIRAVMLAQP